jgi:endonuclease/exonuclease/phosphatase (EEP) superfamily protein YafD
VDAILLASGGVAAGGLGFLVVLGLLCAAGLLFWSMTRRLRNVRRNYAAHEWADLGDEAAGSGRPADSATTRDPGVAGPA